jgi:hypothetical protein
VSIGGMPILDAATFLTLCFVSRQSTSKLQLLLCCQKGVGKVEFILHSCRLLELLGFLMDNNKSIDHMRVIEKNVIILVYNVRGLCSIVAL